MAMMLIVVICWQATSNCIKRNMGLHVAWVMVLVVIFELEVGGTLEEGFGPKLSYKPLD